MRAVGLTDVGGPEERVRLLGGGDDGRSVRHRGRRHRPPPAWRRFRDVHLVLPPRGRRDFLDVASPREHRRRADLAGTPSKPQIAALTSIAKPDRLLYGSDYAWTRREHALQLLTSLDVAF